jgi:hypothetical protein
MSVTIITGGGKSQDFPIKISQAFLPVRTEERS